MADICIRLQGKYFIKSIYLYCGHKNHHSLTMLTHFLLCRNETEKKTEQNNVLKYCGHLGYKNGQLFHPKWLKSVG